MKRTSCDANPKSPGDDGDGDGRAAARGGVTEAKQVKTVRSLPSPLRQLTEFAGTGQEPEPEDAGAGQEPEPEDAAAAEPIAAEPNAAAAAPMAPQQTGVLHTGVLTMAPKTATAVEQAMIIAAYQGGAQAVAAWLHEGGGVDARCAEQKDVTLLMAAAAGGQEAMMRMLLQRGASVNLRHSKGCTALMLAAFNGHTMNVQALIDAKADTSLQDRDGCTALVMAEGYGHTAVAQLLRLHAPLAPPVRKCVAEDGALLATDAKWWPLGGWHILTGRPHGDRPAQPNLTYEWEVPQEAQDQDRHWHDPNRLVYYVKAEDVLCRTLMLEVSGGNVHKRPIDFGFGGGAELEQSELRNRARIVPVRVKDAAGRSTALVFWAGFHVGLKVSSNGWRYASVYLSERGHQSDLTKPPRTECMMPECIERDANGDRKCHAFHWRIHCPCHDKYNRHLGIHGLLPYVNLHNLGGPPGVAGPSNATALPPFGPELDTNRWGDKLFEGEPGYYRAVYA